MAVSFYVLGMSMVTSSTLRLSYILVVFWFTFYQEGQDTVVSPQLPRVPLPPSYIKCFICPAYVSGSDRADSQKPPRQLNEPSYLITQTVFPLCPPAHRRAPRQASPLSLDGQKRAERCGLFNLTKTTMPDSNDTSPTILSPRPPFVLVLFTTYIRVPPIQ